MRRPGLVIVVLAAAVLFFGWETYNAWTAAEEPAGGPAGIAPPARPEVAVDNASREGDLPVQIAVIATKPLFRPDRQPFHENAAAVQRNYEAELARLTLVGVLLQDDARKGLVVGIGGRRQDRWEVGSGDSIPGFTVKEVQPDGLVLSADGREFLLPLYAGGPKGQPAGSLRTEVAPAVPGAPSPGGTPGSARTELAPGIPIMQPPTVTATPPPNVNAPAAQPPPAGIAAPQPSPFATGVRRGYPRPQRPYPAGQ